MPPISSSLTPTDAVHTAPAQAAEPASSSGHKGGLRPEPASDGTHARTVRDFAHPQLKLIRLLHEAAEIEHALMAQYRHLSGDFPIGQHAETIAMLDADVVALLPGTDPHR